MNNIFTKFKKYKKDRKIINVIEQKTTVLKFNNKIQQSLHKFAIIVPFRDNKYQNRSAQLKKFVPEMTRLLNNGIKKLGLGGKREFIIIVVEQSDDNRKFNRGQLLNVGFNLAKACGCDYVIYHDVDLVSTDVKDCKGCEWYLWFPEKPVHIGGGWKDKYKFYAFVGGAFSLSVKDNNEVGGFPNDFWGWGGEDDAFYNRMSNVDLVFIRPNDVFLKEMYHKPTSNIPELSMNGKDKMKSVLQNLASDGRGGGFNSLNKIVVNNKKILGGVAGTGAGTGADCHWGGALLVNVTLQ